MQLFSSAFYCVINTGEISWYCWVSQIKIGVVSATDHHLAYIIKFLTSVVFKASAAAMRTDVSYSKQGR